MNQLYLNQSISIKTGKQISIWFRFMRKTFSNIFIKRQFVLRLKSKSCYFITTVKGLEKIK